MRHGHGLVASHPCASAPAGRARPEAEVGDQEECEHSSIGFEALQTSSALSRPSSRQSAQLGDPEAVLEALPQDMDRSSVEGNPWVKGPNIYLSNLVDQDNYWGYCLDISGSPPHPQCDVMQGHTCKPEGEDTQFRYDPATERIMSENFNGECSPMYDGEKNGRTWKAEANNSMGGCLRAATGQNGGILAAGVALAMVQCSVSDAMQRFTYSPSGKFIVANSSLCLVFGRERFQTDSFSSRSAQVQDCDTWPADLSTWEILTSEHRKYLPA